MGRPVLFRRVPAKRCSTSRWRLPSVHGPGAKLESLGCRIDAMGSRNSGSACKARSRGRPIRLLPAAGVPRINFIGTLKIIPTAQVTVFLYETAANLAFRQVFTDGRPLPEISEHTWLGYSIGKWEGDTFVVETAGLKDGGWLDTLKARPHSDALRVTERLRRTDFGHMELTITINDPKAYIKPWTVKTALNLVADGELLEGSCDNHDKSMEHRRMAPPPPEPPSPGPH